jgi:hypothetical protein
VSDLQSIGDNSTKAMLLDLVRSHISTSNLDDENGNGDILAVDDIIPGKGKGLVILLYGMLDSALYLRMRHR